MNIISLQYSLTFNAHTELHRISNALIKFESYLDGAQKCPKRYVLNYCKFKGELHLSILFECKTPMCGKFYNARWDNYGNTMHDSIKRRYIIEN